MFYKGKYQLLDTLTSKQIRTYSEPPVPIRQFKIGLNLETGRSLTWLYKVNKLNSIKHKNIIMRVVRGDVYTKEKLHRYGLTDNPNCPRCGQIETLAHKVLVCPYVKRITKELIVRTNKLRINQIIPTNVTLEQLLGIDESDILTLTIHCEVLMRIVMLKDNEPYLLMPKVLVSSAIKYLGNCEKNLEHKQLLKSLLD